ncbi:hypothetical protein [Nocardia sp. NPDC050718]|uniref:hypothetical protein n=1 Tax=Nocardia sp. NPDC050718 TaxID=3155788 RepID=UPI0033D829E2
MRRLAAVILGVALGACAILGSTASAAPGDSYQMGETAAIPVVNYNGAATTVTEITVADWYCDGRREVCTVSVRFAHRGTQSTDPATISYSLSFADGRSVPATTEPNAGYLYDGTILAGVASFPLITEPSPPTAVVLRGEVSGDVLGSWVVP